MEGSKRGETWSHVLANEALNFQMTLNVGIGTVGCTSIVFGLLDKIDNGKIFLGLSFTLRWDHGRHRFAHVLRVGRKGRPRGLEQLIEVGFS